VKDPTSATGVIPGRTAPTTTADPAPGRRPLLGGYAARLAVPAVLLLVLALILGGGSQLVVYEATLIAVYAIAAIGQDWLMGRAGQVSIGAAAFLAIGAFTGAKTAEQGWGVFPVPLLVAAVFGGVIGLVVGLTGLRFRGLYLLLSTLALQFIVSFVCEEYQGSAGSFFVPYAHLAGLSFGVGKSFFILEIVVLLIIVVLLEGMYRRAPGRAWRAIAQNEVAAAVTGINVTRWKLVAFVGSSAVTAVAGALLAYQTQNVSYQAFSLDMAISVLVMVFVGGQGSMIGSILGATLFMLLPLELQNLSTSLSNVGSASQWLTTNASLIDNAVYGVALVVVLIFERRGLVGLAQRVGRALARWGRRRAGGPGVPQTADAAGGGHH
jgi:branched-chain amino acid transport system permease protein